MFVINVFLFQAEDGIRDVAVTGVQTCALPICGRPRTGAEKRRNAPPPVPAPEPAHWQSRSRRAHRTACDGSAGACGSPIRGHPVTLLPAAPSPRSAEPMLSEKSMSPVALQRTLLALVALTLGASDASAQVAAAAAAPAKRILIRAGRLIDGLADAPRSDQGVLVEGERIVAVGPYGELAGRAEGADRIDLSAMTVLPGLIDNHTHVLL